jgi:hypothetical protein
MSVESDFSVRNTFIDFSPKNCDPRLSKSAPNTPRGLFSRDSCSSGTTKCSQDELDELDKMLMAITSGSECPTESWLRTLTWSSFGTGEESEETPGCESSSHDPEEIMERPSFFKDPSNCLNIPTWSIGAEYHAERWKDLNEFHYSPKHLYKCHPCKFYYKRGCEHGRECHYCHLCPRYEYLRRQREKKVRKEARIPDGVSRESQLFSEISANPPSRSKWMVTMY